MPGLLSVLNVGAGDLKLTFNSGDPIETDRAKRTVEDMLRRGYVVFVSDTDGNLTKVRSFDGAKNEYILADVPAGPDDGYGSVGQTYGEVFGGSKPDEPVQETAQKRRGRPRKTVKAQDVDAIGIAPTAGG